MCCPRGESGKETLWSADIWGIGKDGRISNPCYQCARSANAYEWWKFHIPIADGSVELSGGDQVLRTSTLIRDYPDRGEEQGNLLGESDGSSSTPRDSRLIRVWWWSKKRFLVHFRELQILSSRWTESHTVRAERRINPNYTTIHRRNQSNKYDFGCDAWTLYRRTSEYRRTPRPIMLVDWIGRKTLQMCIHGPVSGWQRNKRHQGLITCRWRDGKRCQKQRNENKNKNVLSINRSLTTLEDCAVFTSLIQRMRSSKEQWKT